MLNKSAKIIKNDPKSTKIFSKISQIFAYNWQVATQHEPKNRRDFTTSPDINNAYDFIT